MGLRPAKTCRTVKGQAWTRVSIHRPRKSFVKGVPHARVRQWKMGTPKRMEVEVALVAKSPIFVRDNALEAARQATNKLLEKTIGHNYLFRVLKYPHQVIREHAALGVAGADRISGGMKLAFGKPKGRMARLNRGDAVFSVWLRQADLPVAKAALKRGRIKLPGIYDYAVRDIRKDAENLKLPLEALAIETVKVEVAALKATETVAATAAAPVPGKEGEAAVAPAEAAAGAAAKPEAGKKEDKKKEEKKK
ncbi:hypothetical protein COX86_02960 [Candidatus Micrarchaeota archaeon CG_4_10_14_0_2_um_filter_60_11]|nr:MAG: hypothetical protein AUJ16_00885 [Candidatus Micrarchaeota archaeon CG1_02_60_51]PIZ90806.1 MAG: hypothetical protein COX86_02960 [Candidatus Micrarchaeota archaeon CG_4_10_14_0_2_um_filter_60_11]